MPHVVHASVNVGDQELSAQVMGTHPEVCLGPRCNAPATKAKLIDFHHTHGWVCNPNDANTKEPLLLFVVPLFLFCLIYFEQISLNLDPLTSETLLNSLLYEVFS